MASGGVFTPASATLETFDANLILACSLDEAQGVARANPVTGGVTPFNEVNGPIPSVAAKKNNGADFEVGSTQHLKANAAAKVVGGLTQVTSAAWIKWESAVTAVILEEDKSGGGGRFSLAVLSSGAVTHGMDDGAGFKSKTTAAGKVSTGTLAFVAAIINTTNNWISIWVNGVKEVNQSALTMNAIDNTTSINGFNIGGLNASNMFDGIIDEVLVWNTALSDAAISDLYNAGAGRFWRQDVTPPAIPDKVIKYRMKDSANQFVTMISARKGTESDLSHAELSRADLDTATVPTHILEDDADGTTSWPTTAASTTPYKLGGTEDAASLPLEADRYVGWGDPDQTGADDNRAYFMRTVDTFGNQSAWVKAADGTTGATTPAAPTITAATPGNTQITVTVDGDAGITNEVFYYTGTAAPISGGTRTGDGDIVIAGLVNNTVYAVFAQSKNADGSYSPASATRWVVPAAAANSATSAVSGFMDEIRNLFLNSSNLLSWIQTVNGGGSTTGNVILGRRPQTLADPKTDGPIVNVYPEGLSMESIASKAMTGTVDIIGDVVWYEDHRTAKDRIAEINFLFGMMDEFKDDVGLALSATFGGIIESIDVNDLVEQPGLGSRVEWHAAIRFTVSFGV